MYCMRHLQGTTKGTDFPQTILPLKCCTEYSMLGKGNSHRYAQRRPIRDIVYVCTTWDPGNLQDLLQLPKKQTGCFWKRQICLCGPDVYTTTCRLQRGAAWSWWMLNVSECYLCIRYMLVGFQLITKSKKNKKQSAEFKHSRKVGSKKGNA